MRMLLIWSVLMGASWLGGSAHAVTPDSESAPPVTTVVLLRHAEKQAVGKDPELTDAGQARAASIASRYCQTGVRLVVATEYRRTQATAEPCAKLAGQPVQVLAINQDLNAYADALKQKILAEAAGGKVLVIGHSNTVPAIIQAWTGQAVTPISDTEYDRWFELQIATDGQVRLQESRYDATDSTP
ncbi:SixA phosphatase family protein [Ahniella affigens]|nr:phosphoglycerate mutase family protein [Ahniella affigens]